MNRMVSENGGTVLNQVLYSGEEGEVFFFFKSKAENEDIGSDSGDGLLDEFEEDIYLGILNLRDHEPLLQSRDFSIQSTGNRGHIGSSLKNMPEEDCSIVMKIEKGILHDYIEELNSTSLANQK